MQLQCRLSILTILLALTTLTVAGQALAEPNQVGNSSEDGTPTKTEEPRAPNEATKPTVTVSRPVSDTHPGSVSRPVPENARVRRPSEIGYSYRDFRSPKKPSTFPIERMHSVRVFLYPFVNSRVPVGFGFSGSLVGRETGTRSGPLGASVRVGIWSRDDLTIDGFAMGSLNVLSAEELRTAPICRNLGIIGVSLRKDLPNLYLDSRISFTTPGKGKQSLGMIEYEYSYGSLTSGGLHLGAKLFERLSLGGFAQLQLADYYQVKGGAFSYDSGPFRLFSAGPEANLRMQNFALGFQGKYLVSATKGANYDYLGSLLEEGAGQGSVTGTVSILF